MTLIQPRQGSLVCDDRVRLSAPAVVGQGAGLFDVTSFKSLLVQFDWRWFNSSAATAQLSLGLNSWPPAPTWIGYPLGREGAADTSTFRAVVLSAILSPSGSTSFTVDLRSPNLISFVTYGVGVTTTEPNPSWEYHVNIVGTP